MWVLLKKDSSLSTFEEVRTGSKSSKEKCCYKVEEDDEENFNYGALVNGAIASRTILY